MAKLSFPRGESFANEMAAKHVETQAKLDVEAEVVAAVIRNIAGPHGTLASRVSVESGDVDRFPGITDPDIGAIEFGTLDPDAKQVKGLHVLQRAANAFGSSGTG